MTMRTPGDELRNLKREKITHKLFDDEVVGDADVRGGEAEFWKGKVDAVHAKGDLILELAEIGLLQRGSVANDEGTLAFVNIFQRGETFNAFAPPRVKIRGRQLGNAANAVIRIADKIPERLGNNGLEGLLHAYFE